MGRAVGSWSGKLILQHTNEHRVWLYIPDSLAPLTYTATDGKNYRVSAIMDTDGATVPRVFWSIPGLDPMDWPEAATLHDALWEARKAGQLRVSFWRSNRLLQESIIALGWSRFLAWLVFWCVTLFGWRYWIAGERGSEE